MNAQDLSEIEAAALENKKYYEEEQKKNQIVGKKLNVKKK